MCRQYFLIYSCGHVGQRTIFRPCGISVCGILQRVVYHSPDPCWPCQSTASAMSFWSSSERDHHMITSLLASTGIHRYLTQYPSLHRPTARYIYLQSSAICNISLFSYIIHSESKSNSQLLHIYQSNELSPTRTEPLAGLLLTRDSQLLQSTPLTNQPQYKMCSVDQYSCGCCLISKCYLSTDPNAVHERCPNYRPPKRIAGLCFSCLWTRPPWVNQGKKAS